MEGLDDNRICGPVPEPADEHGASLRRHVGRPSAAGPYGTLVWPGGDHREWLVTLPRFPQFWALVIYVFLSGSGTPPLLRLLALAWWFLLCVAPVNTGMVGYADILGPLVIIALVLGCMHLAEKRASRQTKG